MAINPTTTPARRGFLKAAGATIAAPILPGASAAPAAMASTTAAHALASSGIAAAMGFDLAKLLLAQNSNYYVTELIRKGATLIETAEGKHLSSFNAFESLNNLRRFHAIPGSPHSPPGIGFSSLADFGFSTAGDIFSPEMQFFLDHDLSSSDLPKLLEHGASAIPRTPNPNFDHMQSRFKDFMKRAGVTSSMPIQETIQKLQQQQIRSHIESLRIMAIENPLELSRSLIETYSNSTSGLDQEGISQVLRTMGMHAPSVKSPGEHGEDPFASFRDSLNRTIIEHEESERARKTPEIDLAEIPDHLNLFWLQMKNTTPEKIEAWLKEQGVSEKELEQIVISEWPQYILAERGSRAEQVLLNHITSQRPKTPPGWKPQEAEAQIVGVETQGKIEEPTLAAGATLAK